MRTCFNFVDPTKGIKVGLGWKALKSTEKVQRNLGTITRPKFLFFWPWTTLASEDDALADLLIADHVPLCPLLAPSKLEV